MGTEIERRYLLKDIDVFTLLLKGAKQYNIRQYYIKDGTNIVRYRSKILITSIYEKSKKDFYFKTIKHPISFGVFREDEVEITKEEFDSVINKPCDDINYHRVVDKKRYALYDKNQDLIFEVDIFNTNKLIIMEVELSDINQQFEIPIFIKQDIVLEITGMNQFSNHALSLPLPLVLHKLI